LHGKVLDYKKPEFMLSQEKDFWRYILLNLFEIYNLLFPKLEQGTFQLFLSEPNSENQNQISHSREAIDKLNSNSEYIES
jgi:hypothetical protein